MDAVFIDAAASVLDDPDEADIIIKYLSERCQAEGLLQQSDLGVLVDDIGQPKDSLFSAFLGDVPPTNAHTVLLSAAASCRQCGSEFASVPAGVSTRFGFVSGDCPQRRSGSFSFSFSYG